jgi:pimeloyl-ACP methyl ester carboxylesterase
MKHIYCISGFGADERVFANLDFGKNEIHFIPWKIPEKNESIQSYAQRMREEILHPDPILVGLSFGGMMCVEISKIISPEKIILISSIETIHEMPLSMRIAGKLHINKFLPLRPYAFLTPIEDYNLGVETKEERALVKEYRKNINPKYTVWAIEQILQGKNNWYPQNIVHIHGGKDHIFPIKYIKADYVIEDGGHLLLMNRAGKVNVILRELLN